MSIFYENYLKLCAARQESPTAVSKKIGLSNAAATGWKKGKKPSEVTLEKLAVYFGVAREDLTGESGQKEKPSTPEGDGLDVEAKAFAEKFMQLDESTRALFNRMLDAAIAEKLEKNG
jgi:transcriptional regulator with XRE-family HTH domain